MCVAANARLKTFNRFLEKCIKVDITDVQKKFQRNIELINLCELLTQLNECKTARAPRSISMILI